MEPGEGLRRGAGDDLAVARVLRAVAGAGEAVGHAQGRPAHLHRLRLGQGLGYIGGSFMTGSAFWAVVGVLLLALAAVMIVAELRRRSRT